MHLRDLLKKKDRLSESDAPNPKAVQDLPEVPPVFTFMRSDTHSQDIISPPTFSSTESSNSPFTDGPHESRSRLSRFKQRARSTSGASIASHTSEKATSKEASPNPKRLSQRLHLRRSEASSHNVPLDLPDIVGADNVGGDKVGTESQWERRATILARENEKQRSRPSTPIGSGSVADVAALILGSPGKEKGIVATKHVDDNIQEAIRLHEAGELETSTQMFGRLADPNGENNALSQVLYGLALRHGWGCTPDAASAVTYLSAAASNAASIEDLALQAGMKKGGAAKGELVLAIFELANCFRHGWGVEKDPVAALKYYETSANLGDTDAMNEVAWCYLEGFGCKKDKFQSAKYYRLAEAGGSKTLGNSWIWKGKYNAPK
jgi:hypothetical protein